MHQPEAVLENGILKIPMNFVTQTDQLILTRRPHLVVIIKKKMFSFCGFYHFNGSQSEK